LGPAPSSTTIGIPPAESVDIPGARAPASIPMSSGFDIIVDRPDCRTAALRFAAGGLITIISAELPGIAWGTPGKTWSSRHRKERTAGLRHYTIRSLPNAAQPPPGLAVSSTADTAGPARCRPVVELGTSIEIALSGCGTRSAGRRTRSSCAFSGIKPPSAERVRDHYSFTGRGGIWPSPDGPVHRFRRLTSGVSESGGLARPNSRSGGRAFLRGSVWNRGRQRRPRRRAWRMVDRVRFRRSTVTESVIVRFCRGSADDF